MRHFFTYHVDWHVLQGYGASIDEVDFQSLVPVKLQRDRSILFTNISEIHEFHAGQVICIRGAPIIGR